MSHAVPGPADQDRDRRRPWWLWLLLGLLGIALLSVLLTQCGTDDDGNASTTTPGTTTAQTGTPATGAATEPSTGASTPATASSPATPSPGESSGTPASPEPSATATAAPDATATSGSGGGVGGTLVAGSKSVLADGGGNPATALAGQVGQNATATRVPVQSVPADEGFWVGTSETDRAWVQLTGDAGESAYQVKEGDLVDFTGKVVAHNDAFPSRVGVSADEGSEQLIQQKAHVSVPKADVKLSD